ncbi:hypothetical protein DAMA08_007600 [Martiniozyma asiatica (nom. inval.)]|nr:hypothetical protein DAMA08_007600 [Martiniozyma asiatica]
MLNIGIPENFDVLFKFKDDVSNAHLYESWKPKINAYKEALDKAQPAELRAPATDIPSNLDSKIFNTVQYLNQSNTLSDKEKEITSLTATELAAKIAQQEYSSVAVLKAFAHRAVVLNQFTNFAMQFFIDEGLKRAEELDEIIKKTGKTVGPLHGLPISLKEHIGYEGKNTNGGWVSMLDDVTETDPTTVNVLKRLGAVFYVRTNQPQTLMHLDSNNNIVGRTRNPYNSLLTSGGSSGGEGACIGGKGSALGVGTDIGGSIRAPAAFCNCYGLRPTSRRLSTWGGLCGDGGQESVVSVVGPLANSVKDIELFMKSYINEGKPWDEDQWSIPVLWRDVSKPIPGNVTVAIMYDNGQVKPHPPILRGLNFAAQKLKAAGVNIVEFDPIDTKKAYDVVNKMFTCDNNFEQKSLLRPSGEPLLPLTKLALSFSEGKEYTVTQNRELNYERDLMRQKYLNYFVDNKIDFIISPAGVGVAGVGIEDGQAGPGYWGYTSLFNVLDLPTLAFPTGLYQDPNIDVKDTNYIPRSEMDKIEQDKYIPELFSGAPIGLQISGRRYFDEEVVAFGKLIDEMLKA